MRGLGRGQYPVPAWPGVDPIRGSGGDLAGRGPVARSVPGPSDELGEGPCRDAIHEQHRVLIEDMGVAAGRWRGGGRGSRRPRPHVEAVTTAGARAKDRRGSRRGRPGTH